MTARSPSVLKSVEERNPSPIGLQVDMRLGHAVNEGIRRLARHDATYARFLAGRNGVRLAFHVATGDVFMLTPQGMATLQHAQELIDRALTIEPGLNVNAFNDQLTGRDLPPVDRAS